jgi:hypothetical protein
LFPSASKKLTTLQPGPLVPIGVLDVPGGAVGGICGGAAVDDGGDGSAVMSVLGGDGALEGLTTVVPEPEPEGAAAGASSAALCARGAAPRRVPSA